MGKTLLLALLCLCLGEARPEPASSPERRLGESYCIRGSWFQYLGTSESGAAQWLYPHLDGVNEVFQALPGERSLWKGSLSSRFDPSSGAFTGLFNVAEVLNELLDEDATRAQRVAAASLLRMFLALHGGEQPPYYLRSWIKTIDRRQNQEARNGVTAALARHRRALSRVSRVGTRVPGLSASVPLDSGPSEYYRRMVADGYLDIAVVGGNLQNKATGEFHSWRSIEGLRERLDALGFRRAGFRRAEDSVLSLKTTTLLGQPIRVRVHATGGSHRKHRIRRAVANFVEGLAHADVFIFHGHSNEKSGVYFAAEERSSFARFRVGLRKPEDLRDKCHGLGERPYQLIALQSCESYNKYCRSLHEFLSAEVTEHPGRIGFIGNSAKADMRDFVPRYAALIEFLLGEKGAKDMASRMNSIRPRPETPLLVFRGVLQPRFSFIVPEGIEIVKFEELGGRSANVVRGTGSDGRIYYSTEVFPQNRPGEVVQVAATPLGVYGLRDDGRVLLVNNETGGGAVEATFFGNRGAKVENPRFTFMAYASYAKGRPQLCLVGTNGRLYLLAQGTRRLSLAVARAPRGVLWVAVGNDEKGRFVGEDREGHHYELNRRRKEFHRLPDPLALRDISPSLQGHGVEGTLWEPKDRKP